MADISGLSETDGSNTSITGISVAEGTAPSNINDAIRAMAGMLKRDWDKRGPTMTSGGSANAHTLTPSVAQASLVQGDTLAFIAGFTNTGATTLAISGLTAKAIRYLNVALAGGEIVAGQTVVVMYDGTAYQLVSSPGNAASPYAGFKNVLVNGDMEVWQWGAGGAASIAVPASTTFGTVGSYGPDRWTLGTQANQACTLSQQAGLTNGSRFCARVQRNNGQTGIGLLNFDCALDADMIAAIRGSIVTLSMVMRSGANFSPTSGAVTVRLSTGTGSTLGVNAGAYTSASDEINSSANITSTATRYSFTSGAAIRTTIGQAVVQISVTPVGTAGAADYFEIDEVQLEISPFATTFDRRPFVVELAECQRYYQKSLPYAVAPAQSAGVTGGFNVYLGTGQSGTNGGTIFLRPTMRVTPSTVTTYNPSAANANVRDTTNSADRTITVGTLSDASIPFSFASGAAASNNVVHFAAFAEIPT